VRVLYTLHCLKGVFQLQEPLSDHTAALDHVLDYLRRARSSSIATEVSPSSSDYSTPCKGIYNLLAGPHVCGLDTRRPQPCSLPLAPTSSFRAATWCAQLVSAVKICPTWLGVPAKPV